MRYSWIVLLALAGACESTQEGTQLPDPDVIGDSPELMGDEANELAKRTYMNVRHREELRKQGLLQQMNALHRNIARTVDENFATYKRLCLDRKGLRTPRNWAVSSIGFALEKRTQARRVLEEVIVEEPDTWILANACLGLSILADEDTDLSRVIPLVGHGDPEVRTSAATCIKEVWRVRATPRTLTPQHFAAIDRLVTLLTDRATSRGRVAAAWALANLRHPDTLEYLLVALQDSEDDVKIGGLAGIELLGDARALEPLFDFLDRAQGEEVGSWAKKALSSIAVQNGFAKTPSELDELGTSGRSWRKWYRARRSN